MLILPVDKFEEDHRLPLEMTEYEEKVNKYCTEIRKLLEEVWLKDCADIVLKHKKKWIELVPRSISESSCNIENMFRAALSIMSIQLRSLVRKSLDHFTEFLLKFKVRCTHLSI